MELMVCVCTLSLVLVWYFMPSRSCPTDAPFSSAAKQSMTIFTRQFIYGPAQSRGFLDMDKWPTALVLIVVDFCNLVSRVGVGDRKAFVCVIVLSDNAFKF